MVVPTAQLCQKLISPGLLKFAFNLFPQILSELFRYAASHVAVERHLLGKSEPMFWDRPGEVQRAYLNRESDVGVWRTSRYFEQVESTAHLCGVRWRSLAEIGRLYFHHVAYRVSPHPRRVILSDCR